MRRCRPTEEIEPQAVNYPRALVANLKPSRAPEWALNLITDQSDKGYLMIRADGIPRSARLGCGLLRPAARPSTHPLSRRCYTFLDVALAK